MIGSRLSLPYTGSHLFYATTVPHFERTNPRDGEGGRDSQLLRDRRPEGGSSLTANEILDGKRAQVPFGHTKGFKKAGRKEADNQGKLI